MKIDSLKIILRELITMEPGVTPPDPDSWHAGFLTGFEKGRVSAYRFALEQIEKLEVVS